MWEPGQTIVSPYKSEKILQLLKSTTWIVYYRTNTCHRSRQNAQFDPQIIYGVQADQQQYKKTNEFNANRTGQHGSGEQKPTPPSCFENIAGLCRFRNLNHTQYRRGHET